MAAPERLPGAVDLTSGAVVTAGWLGAHLHDLSVRPVHVDEDEPLYGLGHVLGAALLRWDTALLS